MKKFMNHNERIFVRSFPGATVEDMADHVKPSLRHSPDLLVLHAGTNDLRSEMPAKRIADNIVKLALEMKSDSNDVMISSLIGRADDENLHLKSLEVNNILVDECNRYSLFFINNNNIDPSQHLNGGGLHLNYDGTDKLTKNFLESIRI